MRGALGNMLTTPGFYRRNRTELERNRRKLRGKRPAHKTKPHEAQGAVRGALGNMLTIPGFLQAEPDGTGAEPEEASRKTPGSLNGTGRNRRRNRPFFAEALSETPISSYPGVLFLKLKKRTPGPQDDIWF